MAVRAPLVPQHQRVIALLHHCRGSYPQNECTCTHSRAREWGEGNGLATAKRSRNTPRAKLAPLGLENKTGATMVAPPHNDPAAPCLKRPSPSPINELRRSEPVS